MKTFRNSIKKSSKAKLSNFGPGTPKSFFEKTLHPQRLTFWCVFWSGEVIGSYFFNGMRYREMIMAGNELIFYEKSCRIVLSLEEVITIIHGNLVI